MSADPHIYQRFFIIVLHDKSQGKPIIQVRDVQDLKDIPFTVPQGVMAVSILAFSEAKQLDTGAIAVEWDDPVIKTPLEAL